MVRRSHWYLFLLLGTVLSIVSCSSQTTEQPGNVPQSITPAAITKEPDVTITVVPAMTGALMQTVTVENHDAQTVEQFTEVPLIPAEYLGRESYANGSLFVVYPSGENVGDLMKMGWMESLWRFPTAGSGTRLLEGRGLRTAVSLDGRFVAGVDSDGIKILRSSGSVLTKSLEAVLGADYEKFLNVPTLSPIAVDSLSSWFYFQGDKPLPELLIRVDNTSGALERFSLAEVQIHKKNDVEPSSGRIVFWDRAEEISQDQLPSVLRTYNPQTKKNKILAELAPGVRVLDIYWEDETTVTYKDASGTHRVSVQ